MDLRILGPLEVDEAGRAIPIVGRMQRALLAILLVHANEPVSSDQLIDDLWGEHVPKSARKGLQVQVSRLRKALGDSSSLLGAAESLAEVLGNTVGVKLEQGFFLPAREEIGEARWRAGYADGARLSFDEAVNLALDRG